MANPPASVTKGEEMRHFLTFRLADRRYALPAEDVVEIIRIPPVARIPQSPKGLMGVANLRGSVVPVASTRSLLGQAEGIAGQGRAIVMDGAAPVALAVDAVEELLQVASGSVETRQAELSAHPEERLQGAFRPSADADFVKILDIQSLLSGAFVARARVSNVQRKVAVEDLAPSADEAPQTKLVSFEVNGQEYALPLEAVQEIVPSPATLASVPHADAIVLGMANLRDALLPLLSLRALLGFHAAVSVTGREKVVVTLVGGGLVGLVVDRMRSLFAADEVRMDAIPDVLAARIGGESRVKAIYRDAHGGLVSILAPEQLFGEDVMRKLGSAQDPVHQLADSQSQDGKSMQFLVFRLGEEEFGLPIEAVEEVARVPDQIARVPKTPKFLEGVINMRGEVLPVVDQRRRFNMPKLEDASARRLIVVHTAKLRAGLIVDSVSEVLRSAADAMEPAPDLTGEETKLVQGIINLEKAGRIILVLDPSELLSRTEQGLLEAFDMTKGTPGRSDG